MARLDAYNYTDNRVEISTTDKAIATRFLGFIDSLIDKAYTNRDFDALSEYVKAYKDVEAQIKKVFGEEEKVNE